jgi:hypothetical protein
MSDLARTHWCMQVKVSIEVATVFPSSSVVDFLLEVRRLEAGHRCTVLRRRTPGSTGSACAMDGACVADGKRVCYIDGWRRPSRCGVSMVAMTSWSTS